MIGLLDKLRPLKIVSMESGLEDRNNSSRNHSATTT